ncbi:DUF6702 family protein [Winogradskyella sp.]|uniref:DUF6702 family protein n=1 Tax=Winogradskyella sp. TaxID=1883156 RepID=UPI0035155616
MKSIPYILAFIIAPILVSNTLEHEYYVSVTKIEYAEEQQSLQIISQIFIDDLEALLKMRYNEDLKLAPDSDANTVDTYMKRYLSDKLELKVNGNPVKFNFIGKEYKDDIAYCYLEVENVSNIRSIEVSNRILFDKFADQQNIVRLKLLGNNKSFLLVPDNDKCMLNFD